jgi:hypothetical protein
LERLRQFEAMSGIQPAWTGGDHKEGMRRERIIAEDHSRGLLLRIIAEDYCRGLLQRIIAEDYCRGLLQRVILWDLQRRSRRFGLMVGYWLATGGYWAIRGVGVGGWVGGERKGCVSRAVYYIFTCIASYILIDQHVCPERVKQKVDPSIPFV